MRRVAHLLPLALILAACEGSTVVTIVDPNPDTTSTPLDSLVITTASLATAEPSVPYSQALSAVGGGGSYVWSVSSGSLPGGLSLSGGGMISGVPTGVSSAFSAAVTSADGQNATRVLNLSVDPVLSMTSTSLPQATSGTAYGYALTASGGRGGYAWSVVSGSLPSGLTLSAAGQISGTTTDEGMFDFAVGVVSGGQTAAADLELEVLPSVSTDTLAITTATLPAAEPNVAYSLALAATGGGGGFVWSVSSGALPTGLSLSGAGVISGLPTGTSSSFTVSVSSTDGQTAAKAFTLTVDPLLTVTTTSLPQATSGESYGRNLAGSGGRGGYVWSVISGALPGGLALSSGGRISGTTTAVGTASFTVQVTSGGQSAVAGLQLQVIPSGPVDTLRITTTSLPAAEPTVAYSAALAATGGGGGYVWSVSAGSLPAGLSLSATGVVSGVPSGTSGSFTASVSSTDGQTATRMLTLTVDPVLNVTSTALPQATSGQSYSQALTATGGRGGYSWSLVSGSLPSGLTLSSGGQISGTTTATGTATFSVQVTSGGQVASASLQLQVVSSSQNIFFTEQFENANAASRGWFGNTAFTLTNAHAVSGTQSLELRYSAGQTVPGFGGSARILFTATPTVYVSYWVKYSTNWVGSGQSYHPHEFYLMTDEDDIWEGPAFTRLTTYIEHGYQGGGLRPRLGMQDGANIDQSRIGVDLTGVTEDRSAAGCNGNGDPYPTGCYSVGSTYYNGKWWEATQTYLDGQPGPTNKNDWHFVEVYFELNSIVGGVGQADGVATYWLDGQVVLDIRDALFRTGTHPTMGFHELLIGPYIGDGSPVNQTFWIDDLRVGDRR